jgi:hypothetical protein
VTLHVGRPRVLAYRCSIAVDLDDLDPASRIETFESWSESRWWMLTALAPFLDDPCPTCKQDGTRAFVDLAMASSEAWERDVDGMTYAITLIYSGGTKEPVEELETQP